MPLLLLPILYNQVPVVFHWQISIIVTKIIDSAFLSGVQVGMPFELKPNAHHLFPIYFCGVLITGEQTGQNISVSF